MAAKLAASQEGLSSVRKCKKNYFYFVCLLCCINVFFSPVLTCNLSLTLCCIAPLWNYLYLHCAVSVISLVLQLLTRHINNK
jgi:hypothetical protein